MLSLCVKADTVAELKRKIDTACHYQGIIELRIDALPHQEWDKLSILIYDCTLPVILTLRTRSQGGEWEGDSDTYDLRLHQLAALKPAYLDVEYTYPVEKLEILGQAHPHVKVLLSYHNLTEVPVDLESLWERLQAIPADLYKMVLFAQDTIDALRVALFSKQVGEQLIAFAMGDHGSFTRILAPLIHNRWTYAAIEDGEQCASGQLSVRELLDVYHYDQLSGTTRLCGLIGSPVAHSIGHRAHNRVYRQEGIDALYVKMVVEPAQLKAALEYAESLNFRGLSVTRPLKEMVIPYVDCMEEHAAAIGAVNTLTFEADGWHGKNTDAAAALDAIEQVSPVEGKSVLLLGAGGVARAIAYEAKTRGGRVTVAARRVVQARELAEALCVEWCSLDAVDEYQILINCTPSDDPLQGKEVIAGSVILDVRTGAVDAPFLRRASDLGCRCIDGLEMWQRQAVGQVSSWFSTSTLSVGSLKALDRA